MRSSGLERYHTAQQRKRTNELTRDIDRRNVLKALGTGAIAGAGLAGNAAASPKNNFDYVKDGSELEGETVTLSGPLRREKVFCDAGGGESRIKTQVWNASNESVDDELYLIPSGHEDGDPVAVGSVFTYCTRNGDIEGEVAITKKGIDRLRDYPIQRYSALF